MQRVRSNIPPEPIQTHFGSRRSRSRHLKNPARNPQRRIRGHYLHAGNPFSHLAPLDRANVSFVAVVGINISNLLARLVSKCFGSSKMSEEGAVTLQDVGFRGATGGYRVGSVRPRAGVFSGIGRGKAESAQSNANIKVGKYQLDTAMVSCT